MTTTGGLRFDERWADVDAVRRADVALLRSALSGLTGDTTPARPVSRPDCRLARAAMHDYVKGRLAPSRQRRVAAHLDRCSQCTSAFTDVRALSWVPRGLGRTGSARVGPAGTGPP